MDSYSDLDWILDLFFFFFIYGFIVTASKVRPHVRHWYTKTPLFFPFFFQRELNVLPVICLIYCPLNIAKSLQGATLEVAPWQVASSKKYTGLCTSHEDFEALRWEQKAVWMWAGLPHWARIHTDLWLCVFMAEQVRWRQSGPSSEGVVPCCLLTTLLLKTTNVKQRSPLAQLSWCFKDAQP